MMNARGPLVLVGLVFAAAWLARDGANRGRDIAAGPARSLASIDRGGSGKTASTPLVSVVEASASRPPVPSDTVGEDASVSPGEASASPADEEALLKLIGEAQRETDSLSRKDKLAEICFRWAGVDPPGAIRLAMELGLDPMDGALVPNLAQQWAAGDGRAALAWARTLPRGALRDEVYSRIIYEQAVRDPADAVHLVREIPDGSAAREEAALTLLHIWTVKDPRAAEIWAASMWPTGGRRDSPRGPTLSSPQGR